MERLDSIIAGLIRVEEMCKASPDGELSEEFLENLEDNLIRLRQGVENYAEDLEMSLEKQMETFVSIDEEDLEFYDEDIDLEQEEPDELSLEEIANNSEYE